MDAKVAAETLKEAYEIQESITRMKKTLKQKEELYKGLLQQLADAKVERLGDYGMKKRITSRRVIRSEEFRLAWPELFNQIAKVTLKDAEALVTESALNEVCDTTESVSWKVQFYGQGKGLL